MEPNNLLQYLYVRLYKYEKNLEHLVIFLGYYIFLNEHKSVLLRQNTVLTEFFGRFVSSPC